MAENREGDSEEEEADTGRSSREGPERALPAWMEDRPLLLELFVAVNLAFLVADTWIAHEANDFAHPAEYVPPIFSGVAAALLGAGLVGALRSAGGGEGGAGVPAEPRPPRDGTRGALRTAGWVVGGASVLVGVAGLLLHLEGQFFQETTLRSLVYSAPFAAPLSFAGVGFLLLMNRMVDPRGERWAGWVLLLTLGGFAGNFGLALADHAQNGFFYATEWISVAASALGVGYLTTLFVRDVELPFLRLGYAVMGLQALVGVVGLAFHVEPIFEATRAGLAEKILYGAPVFAPLLFPNLALLGALGLWDLESKRTGGDSRRKSA